MQVAGYAVGGGHVLHMVCDLTIAADNAVFGQTGPKVDLISLSSWIAWACCNLVGIIQCPSIWSV